MTTSFRRQFAADRRGSIAIIAALALPLAIAAMGFAIDYTFSVRDQAEMRAASDTTALALARELAVISPSTARVQSMGAQIGRAELKRRGLDEGATVAASVDTGARTVWVRMSRPTRGFFAGLTVKVGKIGVASAATLSGRRKICVVALDEASAQTIHLKSNSWLTADGCDVFSNSKSPSGVASDSGIKLTAELTCSVGGFSGAGWFGGEKLTDCPPIPDPLASRSAPPADSCAANRLEVIDKGSASQRHRLRPGVYCGGLFIGGNSMVEFDPGVYVVKDGPLTVDSNANARGVGVGFYLSGEQATFHFLSNAKVWLDAPRDGPLAGLLFFEDRTVSANRDHEIKSNFVSNLTGTVYLPRGRLVVDATNEVAQQSAFTVIVARQILLTANPKLFVNSDYGITDVPVPAGLGAVNSPVRLAH